MSVLSSLTSAEDGQRSTLGYLSSNAASEYAAGRLSSHRVEVGPALPPPKVERVIDSIFGGPLSPDFLALMRADGLHGDALLVE